MLVWGDMATKVCSTEVCGTEVCSTEVKVCSTEVYSTGGREAPQGKGLPRQVRKHVYVKHVRGL